MIPIIFGAGLAIAAGTAYALGNGASAGAGYAFGRKTGRVLCEKLDFVESRLKDMITITKE
ncbi:MAG TPA: hypothetical protein EYQ73_02415 [Candidatus Poseidoniales archaeon]|jgi:hypothetical protein|nr:MAG: hypothetical protein CXT71_03345 [Euryarchaeota archaeon]HIF45634.1 hypothetical protein [Candidatus Poseidoniales archaeon]HIL66023.1 hypothetical protein [Candidatus Poseidoniales archaeon]